MEAGALRQRGGGRSVLERSPLARLADPAFRGILTALALGILLLIGFFFYKLIAEANPALSRFGVFGFTFDNNWNPSASVYGALPLLVGTLITSAIALAIGVPVAVAAALYLTELCPKRFRGPLTLLVDLLAAVPSVVYGLWGIFVLAPALQPLESSFAKALSFIPFVSGTVVKPSYFIAGLILAIMILRALRSQGSGAGARSYALGDDPHRCPALFASRHDGCRHARAGPRDRRDDRRDARDR